MRILLISTAFNGLCQRVHRELHLMGHELGVELAISPESMIDAVTRFEPDLIICPFLTKKIPEVIWKNHVCLIVHPGIIGDRGPSSLDWAISNRLTEWGVTVLQAAEEMDAGDIWASDTFLLRKASKANIYRREVTQKALELIKVALKKFQDKDFKPKVLNYDDPTVLGKLQPLMKQSDRAINWQLDNTDTIITKINAADSLPGVSDTILSTPVYIYNASYEPYLRGAPGDIIARDQDAICRATTDGALWIKQAKIANTSTPTLKLPATAVIDIITAQDNLEIPHFEKSSSNCTDITTYTVGDIAYLHFNFSGGAFTTEQCRQLRETLIQVKRQPVKIIVLMGGEDFWSNGINLNYIEASNDPAQAAWANINMIDDLVLEIINSPDQITVAALRTNAGAGGAMMALACDKVIVRKGVVLNPHYQTMHLYGSEYWTYLLPSRVGKQQAEKLTRECLPLLSTEAVEIHFADKEFDEDWASYHVKLTKYCQSLTDTDTWRKTIDNKNKKRTEDEAEKPLIAYRVEELNKMRLCFFDPNCQFNQARKDFVYKSKLTATPNNIAAPTRYISSKIRQSQTA